MTPLVRELEAILASDLQPWEKVERISGALRESPHTGPEAAAWLLVMKEVRPCAGA